MIPTIGRIVWYYPESDSGIEPAFGSDCVGCMVQGVRQDTVVVSGVTADGEYFASDWIPLFEPDKVPAEFPETGGYATWMPYQVQQTAKEQAK